MKNLFSTNVAGNNQNSLNFEEKTPITMQKKSIEQPILFDLGQSQPNN